MTAKILKLAAATVFAAMVMAGVAEAQTPAPADKPTVAKYLADGYTVQRSDIGNPFLQFILQKSTASGQVLVWCSVQVQTGETSSCRTIK
ncbi:MAG: hypothetical protein WCG92_15420 [Hyphomicrobiales bacterium]|nr:hypothetical protein [Alphaproteobacteria bacterium]